ncbi:hypothetical protein J437_LFUL011071, partial [Ladona fulva]
TISNGAESYDRAGSGSENSALYVKKGELVGSYAANRGVTDFMASENLGHSRFSRSYFGARIALSKTYRLGLRDLSVANRVCDEVFGTRVYRNDPRFALGRLWERSPGSPAGGGPSISLYSVTIFPRPSDGRRLDSVAELQHVAPEDHFIPEERTARLHHQLFAPEDGHPQWTSREFKSYDLKFGRSPKHKEIDKVMKKARSESGPQSNYWTKKLLEAEEKDPNR